MLYRKASKRELRKSPTIKAYGWVFSWYHWLLPVWWLWLAQRPPRWIPFEDMLEWLEPGDSYDVLGGQMTFDGYGDKIGGMDKLFGNKDENHEHSTNAGIT